MGSGKPRASAPQVIYYTSPPPTPADPGPSEEEKIAAVNKEREQNLLRRGRGTLGTIMNGFRGLLSQSNPANQRKSLLGE